MTATKRASSLAIAIALGLELFASTPAAASEGTVSLVVDYSNGARKTFAHLPWAEGMDILDTLHSSAQHAPGLAVEEVGTIRSGETSAVLDCAADGWIFWINQQPMGRRLRPGGRNSLSGQRVQPGDVVLAKSVGGGGAAKPMPATSEASVALIIDYSNGVEKSFAALPWRPEMDVLELLLTAATITPGVDVDFGVLPNPNAPDIPMVDRANHEMGALRALDGIGGEGAAWQVWIDGRDLGTELRARSRFSGGSPRVDPGDVVLLKRVASESAHAGPWLESTSPELLQPAAGPACG
jgi:hypothetical protein